MQLGNGEELDWQVATFSQAGSLIMPDSHTMISDGIGWDAFNEGKAGGVQRTIITGCVRENLIPLAADQRILQDVLATRCVAHRIPPDVAYSGDRRLKSVRPALPQLLPCRLIQADIDWRIGIVPLLEE